MGIISAPRESNPDFPHLLLTGLSRAAHDGRPLEETPPYVHIHYIDISFNTAELCRHFFSITAKLCEHVFRILLPDYADIKSGLALLPNCAESKLGISLLPIDIVRGIW